MLDNKSELETIIDLYEIFKESHKIADNILHGGNPCEENISFYTRQREWSAEIMLKLGKIKSVLETEDLIDRILRCINKERDMDRMAEIVKELSRHRDYILRERIAARQRAYEERERKLEEQIFKQEEEMIAVSKRTKRR